MFQIPKSFIQGIIFLKKILEMHFIIEYMVKINLAETFQFYFPELS